MRCLLSFHPVLLAWKGESFVVQAEEKRPTWVPLRNLKPVSVYVSLPESLFFLVIDPVGAFGDSV